MNRLSPALLLLAAAVTTAGCGREAQPASASDQSPAPRVLATEVVHRQKINDQLTLAARVQPNPTTVVHIYPPLSGRVLALHILPGQEVHKDQIIGMLQSTDLEQAQSDYEKAKIEAARADLQLDRARDLLKHEVMAQRDYDDLLALDKADHAEVERAAETLRILGYSPDHPGARSGLVAIRSPRSGVVLDVGTGAGELQRSLDNATPIATIADIDPVWVVADLFPRDVQSVRTGQPVEVRITGYPDAVYRGRVDNISDAVDPVTLTLKVRVILPNPRHLLKPQMYATVAVTDQTRMAILAPATAVIRDGVRNYVFLETLPDKYIRRDVRLGATHEGDIEILDGLADGDRVVTTGTELLRGAGAE